MHSDLDLMALPLWYYYTSTLTLWNCDLDMIALWFWHYCTLTLALLHSDLDLMELWPWHYCTLTLTWLHSDFGIIALWRWHYCTLTLNSRWPFIHQGKETRISLWCIEVISSYSGFVTVVFVNIEAHYNFAYWQIGLAGICRSN